MIILDAHNPAPLVEQFARQRVEDHRTHSKDSTVLYSSPRFEEDTLLFEPVLPQKALLPHEQNEEMWLENLQVFATLVVANQCNESMPNAIGAGLGVMQTLFETLGPKGLRFDSITIEAFAQKVDVATSELKSHPTVGFDGMRASATPANRSILEEFFGEELFPAAKAAS